MSLRAVQRAHVRLLTLVIAAACGNKAAEPPPVKDDAAPGPTVAPIAGPTLGVDRVERMNYVWGSPGSTEYARARAACCSKGKAADWAQTRSHAEAALGKDAHHIGAHWLLGVALAQQGDHAAAVDHLVQAIAADYLGFGATLAEDKDLAGFLATPHGAAVRDLAAKLGQEFQRRAAAGLLVVARRSRFRWPKKRGVQYASTRGEIFAYDRETRRYLRLTHTGETVAGYVRAPGGGELAVLAIDQLDRPKGDDVTPLITRARVFTVDTKDWRETPRATFTGSARELSLGYGAGGQVLLAAAPAVGRWGVGAPEVRSYDRATGKLTKAAGALPVPRIVASLEESRVIRVPARVAAAWTGDPPAAPSLQVEGKPIAIPESGLAAQATVAAEPPPGAHVAFATAVDPCADDTAPSLYVANVQTGALKHLLSARSRFTTRWIAPGVLAYEDGDDAIRLWDASTGREASRLDNRAGLALDVLSLAPAPRCKQVPPTADTEGADGEDELPPEE